MDTTHVVLSNTPRCGGRTGLVFRSIVWNEERIGLEDNSAVFIPIPTTSKFVSEFKCCSC